MHWLTQELSKKISDTYHQYVLQFFINIKVTHNIIVLYNLEVYVSLLNKFYKHKLSILLHGRYQMSETTDQKQWDLHLRQSTLNISIRHTDYLD